MPLWVAMREYLPRCARIPYAGEAECIHYVVEGTTNVFWTVVPDCDSTQLSVSDQFVWL